MNNREIATALHRYFNKWKKLDTQPDIDGHTKIEDARTLYPCTGCGSEHQRFQGCFGVSSQEP